MSLDEQERNKLLMEGTRHLHEQAQAAAQLKEQADTQVENDSFALREAALPAMRADPRYKSPAEADAAYNAVVGRSIAQMQTDTMTFGSAEMELRKTLKAKAAVLTNPEDANNVQALKEQVG